MERELDYIVKQATSRRLDRRSFLGRAAALGVTTATASALLSQRVMAQGPRRGGHLKVGLQGGESTNSLDPATYATPVTVAYARVAGETLVNVSPMNEIEGAAAEEWTVSEDRLTWRFRIRQGMRFHDGRPVTAEDAAQTLRRHSNADSQSGALSILSGISEISTDGDWLVLSTPTPNADLPYLLSDYHLVLQPNGGFDAPNAPVFSGPYRWVQNEPGIRHTFERFEDYWNDAVGHFETIEILVLNDSTARNAALQSGQVQLINRVIPRIADRMQGLAGVTIARTPGKGHNVFVMHCDTAPFDNIDLRMALKLAVDREDLLARLLNGYGTIGNDMPVNASYPFFDETIPQRNYDPDQARFHYERSGHSGAITLRTSDAAFSGAVDAAQLFQSHAAAAGIEIEVVREPADGYWSNVWNQQPFCASAWLGRSVQDQIYTSAYYSSSDWNDTRFFNDRFDQLLIAARAEIDPGRRTEMYGEMGRLVRDEGGLICPMFGDSIDAFSDAIAGWNDDPNGEMMNFFAPIKMWSAT
jgi:peptide/nickel transport system substrate-binding protein